MSVSSFLSPSVLRGGFKRRLASKLSQFTFAAWRLPSLCECAPTGGGEAVHAGWSSATWLRFSNVILAERKIGKEWAPLESAITSASSVKA